MSDVNLWIQLNKQERAGRIVASMGTVANEDVEAELLVSIIDIMDTNPNATEPELMGLFNSMFRQSPT